MLAKTSSCLGESCLGGLGDRLGIVRELGIGVTGVGCGLGIVGRVGVFGDGLTVGGGEGGTLRESGVSEVIGYRISAVGRAMGCVCGGVGGKGRDGRRERVIV